MRTLFLLSAVIGALLFPGSLRAQTQSGEGRIDEGHVVERRVEGHRVRIDLASWRYSIEGPPLKRLLGYQRLERFPAGRHETNYVSLGLLIAKAKAVDDGIVAALELAIDRGQGRLPAKQALIRGLARQFAREGDTGQEAVDLLLAAARSSGVSLDLSEAHAARLDRIRRERASAPFAFYRWNDDLKRGWHRDALLGEALQDIPRYRRVGAMIASRPGWSGTYRHLLRVRRRLTNPPSPKERDLLTLDDAGEMRFLPGARSHETTFVERHMPLPPDFDTLREFAKALRDGRIDPRPRPDSGWYDHVTWAHAALLAPPAEVEGARIATSPSYDRYRENCARAAMALARETHVKRLRRGRGYRPPRIQIRPSFTVEPLPSYYRRRADAYRFLRRVLIEEVGEEALKTIPRLTPQGPTEDDLLVEIERIEGIFRGAARLSLEELGLDPTPKEPDSEDDRRARQAYHLWTQTKLEDPDLKRDLRMMVPMTTARPGQPVRVWAFLGWVSGGLGISSATRPDFEILDDSGQTIDPKSIEAYIAPGYVTVDIPVVVELQVRKVLTRAQFREIANATPKFADLVAKLEGLSPDDGR